jgi:Mn2+/Fe2+ NRAMP family transporter
MLFTYPLMTAVQIVSARMGRTTGRGIAGNLRQHCPSWLLTAIVTLLLIANAQQYRSRPRRDGRCVEVGTRRPPQQA